MIHPTNVDKYEIVGPLGSGHFGQVYHAFDRALRVEKAIKILKAEDPNEFLDHLKEGQILVRCRHKHIVSINEANIFDVNGEQRVVLDLEYMPEGSLEGVLNNRWVSVREAVKYIRGALHGLEHAHSQGFLHRDIKPGNILLSPTGAKLSDFGLATDAGSMLHGSPRGYITHLPPECFTSASTSALTDIYAAGITLFRAVSNIYDWRAVSGSIPNCRMHVEAGTLLKQIGFSHFVPDQIRRIVSKACHADPTKRFQNAGEFGQSLDRLRFRIDWIKVDDYLWRGRFGSENYEATVDTNYSLTVTKNGRRVTVDCARYSSEVDAVIGLESHVAATSFV